MTDSLWRFSPSLGDERLRLLALAPSFPDIAKAINSEMKVLCGHPDKRGAALLPDQDSSAISGFDDPFPPLNELDFWRIVFTVRVPCTVFDWFFNSAHGYRASYFPSPEDGLRNNRILLETVLEKLLTSGQPVTADPKAREFATESLTSGSAKAWLTEFGKQFCDKCAGECGHAQDDVPEIENGRWELVKTRDGRKAPNGTKIQFKGAFLDGKRNELIPADKRHRAEDIFQYGWT